MNKLQQMGHNIEFHNVGIFDVYSKDCMFSEAGHSIKENNSGN